MMERCPVCDSELVVSEVRVKHSVCPKCGYSKVDAGIRAEAPQGAVLIPGLIIGLAFLLVATLIVGSALAAASATSTKNVNQRVGSRASDKRSCRGLGSCTY